MRLLFRYGPRGDRRLRGRSSLDAKPSTVSKERANLQAISKAAKRCHYVPVNPVGKGSKIKVPERKFNVPTLKEIRQLLDGTTGWFRVFISLALNTGMRREEMRTRKWSQIDFSHRQITVASDDSFITKSRRNRTIPMNAFLRGVLSKHPRHITNSYVFPSLSREG